jgi:hypothetical protein
MSACKHPRRNVQRGLVYEHCRDCGATRKIDQPDKPRDKWHTCELCCLTRK